VAIGRRFEFFCVEKIGNATYIRDYRSNNIGLHDAVTFTLIKKAEEGVEEDEDEEESEDDEGEEGSKEGDEDEEGDDEYVFTIKSHATNGDIKNSIMFLESVVSHQVYALCAIWNFFKVNCIIQD
jgi:hypothetical protein